MYPEAPLPPVPPDASAHTLHEVRNLVMAAGGAVQRLEASAPGGGAAEAARDLSIVIGRLGAVLGAPVPRTLRRCDAHAAVRLAARLAQPGDGIAVTVEQRARGGDVGLATGELLQVMLNLLSNAGSAILRHPGADPVIRIRTYDRQQGLGIEVCDRGVGLGEGDPEAWFEPGRSGAGSSGIGLGACRALVEAAGGLMFLENRERGGARVSLWLPRLPARPRTRERRGARRVRPGARMRADITLPGARFGARITDWSESGMRLRGGGLGVPVGARGHARLVREAGPPMDVAIEVVRHTPEGDPCYRFIPGLPPAAGDLLRRDLA